MRLHLVVDRVEMARLTQGLELEAVVPTLPEGSVLIAVLADASDQVLGTWVVLPVVHLEGAWVHPDFRGDGKVLGKLLDGADIVLEVKQAACAWSAALDPGVAAMLARLGGREQPTDARHFVLPVPLQRTRRT